MSARGRSQALRCPSKRGSSSHHFATHEAKGGANLVALQQFMGHARFETTKAYSDEYDAEELALALRPEKPKNSPKANPSSKNS